MDREIGQDEFGVYNNAGKNPGKDWKGDPVPDWTNLTDDVRAKWAAVARYARRTLLDVIAADKARIQGALDRALTRYDSLCYTHNGRLGADVLLDLFTEELGK